jgi:TP901 family phage tail tape measure protein
MPASTREVYLLLRARDEASRIVRGFSSELQRSAAMAQAAALRAEAVTKRQEAAAARAEGASRARVLGMIAAAKALDMEAKALIDHERSQRRFAQSLTAVAGSIETVGIAATVAGGLVLAFLFDSAKKWAEYERQVALTRTQIDGFTASMQQVSDVGMEIARTIPVAFEEIQPALFDIFSSTNANLEQSKILLEGFSKAAVAGQTDIQTAARGTIAIMNAYNMPFEKVNHILDIQFELVRKGVGTYEEFASVFGRIVPSATRAGQSFETVAAMLAFMTRNGQSAAMAAASASRAMEAMSNPKTVDRLEKMGIKVRDISGNFLPLVEVLEQMRAKILALPASDRVKKLSEIFAGAGGTIQARRFLEQILLRAGDLENFKDLLESMGNASGVMEEKFGEMADTSAAKMQLLSNRWMAFRLALGEAVTPLLMELVEGLSKVVEWFNNLDPATKKAIGHLLLIGATLATVGGVLLLFIGFLAAVTAAVVAAGSALLVVAGVITGFGVAVGSVAGVLYSLWQRSDSFRSAILDLKKTVEDFWKNTFEPAWTGASKLFDEKVAPAIKEVHLFLGEKLGGAISFISDLIKNQLGPAIQAFSSWYKENKEDVDKVIGALIVFGGWIVKIGAILTAVFVGIIGGVVIGSILLFVGIIWGVIAVVNAVVVGITTAIKWLERTWPVVWEAIVSFFVDAWATIVDFFTAAWDTITEVFNTVVGFIRGVWQRFWQTDIGQFFIAVWQFILASIQLIIGNVQFMFAHAMNFIKMVWSVGWESVKNVAIAAWAIIVGVFKAVWDALVLAWNALWGAIGDEVKTGTSRVIEIVSRAWKLLKDGAAYAWNLVWGTVSTFVGNIITTLKNMGTSIIDTITNFRTMVWNAGSNLIGSLIDGMTSKVEGVTKVIKGITETISNFLPHSPAKTGPLSGSGNPYRSGTAIADMLARGMSAHTDEVALAAQRMMQEITLTPNADGFTTPTAYGPLGLARVGLGVAQEGALTNTNEVTVNVYTQEIDPRATATELGWELAGRLP